MNTHHDRSFWQRWLSLLTVLVLVLGMLPATSHTASRAASLPLQAELLAEPAKYAPQALQSELPDNSGREFWLAFPINHDASVDPILFITGRAATTGTVTVPGLGFTQDFSVTPGDVTSVAVPQAVNIPDSDVVGDLGIHVIAAEEVAVYGLNRIQYTTDAYLGLPVDVLGTSYMVLQYTASHPEGFAVVATADATTVVITPTVTVGVRAAGIPYTITMNVGQTYQLQNSASTLPGLSGTAIRSDKPIGVYGAVACALIPLGYGACDHIVQQLPPTTSWGKAFVTVPLATRTKGDTFRFLAAHDNTTLTFEGADVGAPAAMLNRGEWHERVITSTAYIVASEPILVAQYSNSTSFDNVTSDPFMMLIPPYEQFGADYTISTPAEGFATNYVNVVAPAAAVGDVILNGAPIAPTLFQPIGSSGFHGAQVPVTLGVHNLSGPLPFGVFAYGFDSYDSYGYPGGMGMAAVATVADINITLPAGGQAPIGAQYCITATATNAQAEPVHGVRVDFTVTGVHTATGFGNTNAAGETPFCYTGDTVGADTVVAAVGTISDTATIQWVEPSVEFTLTITTTGTGAGVVTPTVGAHEYLSGTVVPLAATPDAGSAFEGWSGDAGCVDAAVTMDASKTCTATFTLLPTYYTLTIAAAGTGAGVVTPTVGAHEYLSGTVVPLAATPDAGSAFDGWSGDAGCADAAVTMDASKTCTATFTLTAPPPALDIHKTATPSKPLPLRVNNLIRYTIYVTNTTDSPVTNLIITDTLPAGVAFDSVHRRFGPYDRVGDKQVVWTRATLAPGERLELQVIGKVDDTANPIGWNHVAATCAEDPVAVTATAQVPGDPTHVAGLVIDGTVGSGGGQMQVQAVQADTLVYAITLTNTNAQDTMHNVVISATLPSDVTFISATPEGYTGDRTLVWTLAELEPLAVWQGGFTVTPTGAVSEAILAAESDEQDPVTFVVAAPDAPQYRIYLPLVIRQ